METSLKQKGAVVIKYLNDFKKTSRLMLLGSIAALLINIGLFICYQLSGGFDEEGAMITAFGADSAKPLGMVFFLGLIISTILCIAIGYCSIPFSFPKDKLNPNRVLPWLTFSNGLIQFVLMIFVIIILASEKSLTAVGFVILLIVGFVSSFYNLSFAYPAIKCRFYMPKLILEEK